MSNLTHLTTTIRSNIQLNIYLNEIIVNIQDLLVSFVNILLEE